MAVVEVKVMVSAGAMKAGQFLRVTDMDPYVAGLLKAGYLKLTEVPHDVPSVVDSDRAGGVSDVGVVVGLPGPPEEEPGVADGEGGDLPGEG